MMCRPWPDRRPPQHQRRIRGSVRYAYLCVITICCAVCRAAGDDAAATQPLAADTVAANAPVPRPAPPILASEEYGVAAMVPAGLIHCRRSESDFGPDHGRIVYLEEPAACDSFGAAAGDGADMLPSLIVYYNFNLSDGEYADGERAPRTARELIGLSCEHPRWLDGVTLLGKPAIGCWTEHDGRIEAYTEVPYDLNSAPGAAPDAELGVRLVTTRARLAKDWPLFVQLAGSVYLCAAEWENSADSASSGSARAPLWIGAAMPGRPECPGGGFW